MIGIGKLKRFQQKLNSLKIEINNEETSKERLKEIALTLHKTLLNTIKEALKKR